MKNHHQQPHMMDVCYPLTMYYNNIGDARVTPLAFVLPSNEREARQSIHDYHSYLVWAVKQLCRQYMVDDIVHTLLLWM